MPYNNDILSVLCGNGGEVGCVDNQHKVNKRTAIVFECGCDLAFVVSLKRCLFRQVLRNKCPLPCLEPPLDAALAEVEGDIIRVGTVVEAQPPHKAGDLERLIVPRLRSGINTQKLEGVIV